MRPFSKYIVFAFLVLIGLGLWSHNSSVTTIPLTPLPTVRSYYEPLVSMTLAGSPVFASIADTTETRQLGLSKTTMLPTDVIKLFAFPTDDFWSFWMKDMFYSIDIIWLDSVGKVVHIESNVLPQTYPKSFVPLGRARYVIETNAGFAVEHNLQVGDEVLIPKY